MSINQEKLGLMIWFQNMRTELEKNLYELLHKHNHIELDSTRPIISDATSFYEGTRLLSLDLVKDHGVFDIELHYDYQGEGTESIISLNTTDLYEIICRIKEED